MSDRCPACNFQLLGEDSLRAGFCFACRKSGKMRVWQDVRVQLVYAIKLIAEKKQAADALWLDIYLEERSAR